MAKMTIRECMDAALRLLNQYSIAGTQVPLSYNDQADTENRMIDLINDAQMAIATTSRPIPERLVIEMPRIEPHVKTKDLEYEMPEDFNYLEALRFVPAGTRDERDLDAFDYFLTGDEVLALPNRPAGTYTVWYSRFPVRYASNVDQSTELDNTPDTHVCIPYFVAAMIAIDEHPAAYAALYNVWETKLSRLGNKPARARTTLVKDVYGFDHFRGLW